MKLRGELEQPNTLTLTLTLTPTPTLTRMQALLRKRDATGDAEARLEPAEVHDVT